MLVCGVCVCFVYFARARASGVARTHAPTHTRLAHTQPGGEEEEQECGASQAQPRLRQHAQGNIGVRLSILAHLIDNHVESQQQLYEARAIDLIEFAIMHVR